MVGRVKYEMNGIVLMAQFWHSDLMCFMNKL